MLKKIVSFILTIAMVAGLGIVSFASDTNTTNESTVNEVIIDLASTVKSINTSTRAADWDFKRELVGSETKTKVPIGWADGQLKNGTVFLSGPAGFYWQDGGPSVSVTVSVGYGVFSLNVGLGSVGGSGQWISAPLNQACKLYIYKDITVSKYAVYKKHYGTSEKWYLDHYEYDKEATKVYLDVKKV